MLVKIVGYPKNFGTLVEKHQPTQMPKCEESKSFFGNRFLASTGKRIPNCGTAVGFAIGSYLRAYHGSFSEKSKPPLFGTLVTEYSSLGNLITPIILTFAPVNKEDNAQSYLINTGDAKAIVLCLRLWASRNFPQNSGRSL